MRQISLDALEEPLKKNHLDTLKCSQLEFGLNLILSILKKMKYGII